jgi:insulysin
LFQLLKSTSNPAHAWSKFGTGNHATLRDGPKAGGLDLRAALLKFHAEFYSSTMMRMCVVGREELDQLHSWVETKFSPIARTDRARPAFGPAAMAAPQLGRLLRAIPVKDLRSLQLVWHIPASVSHLYGEKPLELLSHCIGHESEGSVLSYLKGQNWANGLSAGVSTGTLEFTLFSVSVDLV